VSDHGQGNPKQAHVYGPKTVCHSHLYWWQCFHFLCWREMIVSLSHILFLVSDFVQLIMFQIQNHSLLISESCPMDTRNAHKVPYNELCHHLWDSLAPSVHTLLYNPVGPGKFCAVPSECLALWQHQQLNVSVCHTSSALDMLCAQVTTCQHLSCHCWKPCTVPACFHGSTHTPYTFTNWQWIFTGATHITQKIQNTLHNSKSAMVLADHPSLMTYLWHPLIAVQWHILHVLITCLNLQSHDTISCQTCCYLIFWNFLVYLSEVENSKYEVWQFRNRIHALTLYWKKIRQSKCYPLQCSPLPDPYTAQWKFSTVGSSPAGHLVLCCSRVVSLLLSLHPRTRTWFLWAQTWFSGREKSRMVLGPESTVDVPPLECCFRQIPLHR